MATREIEVLSGLVRAVNNLEASRQNQSRQNNDESVEGVMTRLFPSRGGPRRQNIVRDVQQDSDHVEVKIPTFNPSNNYRPTLKQRAKKRSASALSGVMKKKSKAAEERTIVKDVVLIPQLKASVVPKGAAREELFVRGFATTLTLSPSMTEKEIRSVLEEKLNHKLLTTSFPKFQFMRAISNKLIHPKLSDGESFDGRMVKHFAAQGPIYIRATEDIGSFLKFSNIKEEDASDEDSDGSVNMELPTIFDDDDDVGDQCKSTNIHEVPTVVDITNIPSTSSGIIHKQVANVVCPTCNISFSLGDIEEHADYCAEAKWGRSEETEYSRIMESVEDTERCEIIVDEEEEDENDEGHGINWNVSDGAVVSKYQKGKVMEVLQTVNERIHPLTNRIYVRRNTVFDDYVGTRQRSKWMDPENHVKVSFIGESAIDGGGPKREFFTDVLKQVEMRLFDEHGMPIESTVALTSGHFKYAGELMASSIVQGGPAPNFLAACLYEIISKGLENVTLTADMITDPERKELVYKIEQAETKEDLCEVLTTDNALSVLSSVGYRGIPTRESLSSKPNLIRSIIIKDTIEPKLGMICQMENGLSSYGLLGEVRKYPGLFQPLFVAGKLFSLTPDEFWDNLFVRWSEKQAERQLEENTFKYFSDFVEFLHHDGQECNVSLHHLLKFISGSSTLPPLGFGEKIVVTFLHGCQDGCNCRATASTCTLRLTLPVHASSYDLMKEMMVSAMLEGLGFGIV